MKILLAAMSLGLGGAETHICELALALKKRGWQVCIASGGGIYEERLRDAGITCVSVPLFSKNPFCMAESYRKLSNLIKREQFDIVHAHARIPALICGLLQKKYGFRFVTTAHYDFIVTPLLKKLTDWGERCFAVSEDIAAYLAAQYGYPKENITVVPNGIDTEKFRPRQSNGALKKEFGICGGFIVLHVSRLEPYSSLCASELISSAQILAMKDIPLTVVIVGGGSAYAKLKAKADGINAELGRTAVILAGARDNISELIPDADVFVGPSRAAMEAMACGKPTVVSGSQGHIGIFSEKTESECIRTNFCGRGLKMPDAGTLAEELSSLFAMTEDGRRKLGEEGRRFIEEHYSANRMAQIYIGEYENIAHIKTDGSHDFLLCGYYGFGNTGDESLAGCIITAIRRKLPAAEICVMSHSPRKTARRFIVSAVPRMNVFAVKKALENTKTFVFGGGNLIQDKTSPRSLFYYTEIIALAKRSGCRVIILANGLGPLGARGIKRAGRALSLADSISLREEYSLSLCKKLCPASSPHLTFDPAITAESAENYAGKPDVRYFVVAPKYFSKRSENALCEAVKMISRDYSLLPVVIAMYEKEDMPLCRRLAEKTGAKLIADHPDAGELAVLLAGAELSICSRLHALVYSTLAACPMLAVSDDTKLSSYIGLIGESELAGVCCSVASDEEEDVILRTTDAIIASSRKIRANLSSKLPEYKKLFYDEIDRIL